MPCECYSEKEKVRALRNICNNGEIIDEVCSLKYSLLSVLGGLVQQSLHSLPRYIKIRLYLEPRTFFDQLL